MTESVLNQEAKHIVSCVEKYVDSSEEGYADDFVIFLHQYKEYKSKPDSEKTSFLISINMPTLFDSYKELVLKNHLLPSSFLRVSWNKISSLSDTVLTFIFLSNFIKSEEDLFNNQKEEMDFVKDLITKPFMQNAGIFSNLFKKNILNPHVLLNLDLSNINTSYLYIISLLDIDFKNLSDEKKQKFSNDFISSFLNDSANWSLDRFLAPFIENNSIIIFEKALKSKLKLFNPIDKEFAKKILLNLKFNSIHKNNISSKKIKI